MKCNVAHGRLSVLIELLNLLVEYTSSLSGWFLMAICTNFNV